MVEVNRSKMKLNRFSQGLTTGIGVKTSSSAYIIIYPALSTGNISAFLYVNRGKSINTVYLLQDKWF